MTRYDPDGNPKRRAKKGERRCGGCRNFRRWPENYCFWKIPASAGFCFLTCRADDYAGDCKHYQPRGVKP